MPPIFSRYLLALALCALTTLLALPLRDWLDPANTVMLFLLAVFIVAVKLGRGPAAAAAFAGVALFDVFFVPPHLSLTVADAQYLVTFAVMLAVGLITAHLAARLAEREAAAQTRERETQRLYELARALGAALDLPQVVAGIVDFLGERAIAATLLIDNGTGGEAHFVVEGARLPATVADRALEAYRQAGATQTHSARGSTAISDQAGYLLLPFRGATRVRGVLAAGPAHTDCRPLLEAVASLAGIAIERLHYAEVAQRNELDAAAEKLRASILSSLSHDLRTPLTSLVGLADSLVDSAAPQTVDVGETARRLRDQAEAMHRMVSNLLDLARLQTGRVRLNLQWQPLDEVVGSSLRLLDRVLDGRTVSVALPADLPLLQFDAVLIERVLCNLLDNAAKHSPPGAPIQLGTRLDAQTITVAVCNADSRFPAPLVDRSGVALGEGRGEGGVSGSGLGLILAKTIVAAHGGELQIGNSTAGACACFTLPRGKPPEWVEDELS